MSQFENLALSLNPGYTLFILIVLALGGLAYFVYRFTVPPVSVVRRYLLITLRTLALVTALFVLFEPILSVSYVRMEKPVIVVAVDRSVSMTIVDKLHDRKQATLNVARSPVFEEIRADNDLQYLSFADSIESVDPEAIDSIPFSGNATDVSNIFEKVSQKMIGKNLAALVLISDGQSNLGSSPERFASFYDVPIFTVGIGDPADQKDLAVSRILTNEITYAKSAVPVDVDITAYGFKGKRIQVQLRKNGQVIDSRFVDLPEESMQTKVTMSFTPEEEGVEKYEVIIPVLEGELTDRNNRRSFFVRVLKNKTRVLMVSGAPDPQVSALYNTLLDDENIEVASLVERSDGGFIKKEINGPELAYDCMLFNNYPTRISDSKMLEKFINLVKTGDTPLMLLYGPKTDPDRLKPVSNLLPAELKADRDLRETLVYLDLTTAGKQHSVTRLSEDVAADAQHWQSLPPIFIGQVVPAPFPGSEVLARVDMSRATNVVKFRKDIPLIMTRKSGASKTVLLSAYGVWRLKSLMLGANRTDKVYQHLISNSIRWLVTREDEKKVRITTSKQIYRTGEKIEFNAQVYDEQLNPVDGAEVKASILNGDKTISILLNGIGQGRYEASLDALLAGDYTFSGQASKEEKILGKDSGKFTVEAFSLEYLQTRMNEKLLKNVAQNSGGRYFTPDNFAEISQHLKFEAVMIDEEQEIALWNKLFLLILFVALVSTEWFIRKRSGMM